MRVGADNIPQMRVSVVAWANGQNDQKGLQVLPSTTLLNLLSNLAFKTLTCCCANPLDTSADCFWFVSVML